MYFNPNIMTYSHAASVACAAAFCGNSVLGGVRLSKLEYGIFDIPVLTAGISLPAEREFFVVPCIIPAKSSLNETYIDHM